MSQQYVTPLPQEDYQRVGLISAIVGFFVLAYFFMYLCLTQLPGSLQDQGPFVSAVAAAGGGRGGTDRSGGVLQRAGRGHLYVSDRICK